VMISEDEMRKSLGTAAGFIHFHFISFT